MKMSGVVTGGGEGGRDEEKEGWEEKCMVMVNDV